MSSFKMEKFIKAWRESSELKTSADKELPSPNDTEMGDIDQVPITESTSSLNAGSALLKKPSGRNFCPEWRKTFPWLNYKEDIQKVFCTVCSTAFNELNIKRPVGIANDRAYDSLVKNGFSSWSKAIDRFKKHEKSSIHQIASTSIANEATNVSCMLSDQLKKQKHEARFCLFKIFESIKFLAVQGIPIRGHQEEKSNFIQLLYLRAIDLPLLKSWMERSKYKWISHEIINEILTMMAIHVLRKLISEIKKQQFFAIMADETTDISRKEQMSLNVRYVDDNLVVHESFLGFYETPATDSHTLFTVLMDTLIRFDLKLSKCRGQCYDGAFNMSGEITGLQTRIRELEARAYYVHCAGHNLNLVAQDAMKMIAEIADFLSVMRELITFVRALAKRVHKFKEIQSQLSEDDDHQEIVSLKSFCPTRWTVRVKSLKSVKENYGNILKFCELIGQEKNDCGTRARGFLEYLRKFDTFIMLYISISTLEKVEALNETIQATTINFRSVMRRLEILKTNLAGIRTTSKFNELFIEANEAANALNLDEPVLPRRRVAPKRFDSKTNTYHFADTPEDKYRAIYFNVIDQVTTSLEDRFDSEIYEILGKLEDYALNKIQIDDIKEYIIQNRDGKEECDFDLDRLNLHRSMFFDVVKNDKKADVNGLTKISIYLQDHEELREFLTEYVKFIRLLLTSPQTVVIAERSFSSLKRLKTYLQSTMVQQRTNDLAILHVHRDLSEEIDLNEILDEFILKNSVRRNTFALSSEKLN